jgi:hypothetical protein
MTKNYLFITCFIVIGIEAYFENGLEPKGKVSNDPIFSNLRKWADSLERKAKHLYYSPKIAVGTFDSLDPDGKPVSVRGLIAVEDIQPEENLVTVPLEFVFNSGPLMKDSPWIQIIDDNPHWDQYQKFILLMLLYTDKNPEEWSPYLDVWRKAPLEHLSGLSEGNFFLVIYFIFHQFFLVRFCSVLVRRRIEKT